MTAVRATPLSPTSVAMALGAAFALTLLPGTAVADPLDSVIIDSIHQGSAGAVAVNIAAGNNNQQANAGVIAIGETSLATGLIDQRLGDNVNIRSASKVALIGGNAFANSSGLIAVNIASGSDNQQANLAVIAIGIEGQAVTDALLSQTRASQQPVGQLAEADAPEGVTGFGPGAFENSSGLVQVSLIGGERNTSANTFALTIQGGGKP